MPDKVRHIDRIVRCIQRNLLFSSTTINNGDCASFHLNKHFFFYFMNVFARLYSLRGILKKIYTLYLKRNYIFKFHGGEFISAILKCLEFKFLKLFCHSI